MNSAKRSQAPGHRFAADLLERGAAGYAGFAAALMAEQDATPGPITAAGWRSHLTQRVLELAAAVGAGEPRLFSGRITWARKAFKARGHADTDLVRSLKALRDTLAERLPAPAAGPPLEYLDAALGQLQQPAPAPDRTALDPTRPADRLALQYLQQVLEGNVAEAIALVTRAAGGSFRPPAIYTEVLLPAQREVGRLWHAGEISIAEEHMVTSATQRAMAVIASQAQTAPANGRTVVVAAVAGNAHDVGLRALADMYQLAGWRVLFVGADVPMHDLPNLLTFFEADLLMLGATLTTHVSRVEHTIAAIRERCERPVKIVVGGAAFDEAPDLVTRVGGDAYAPTIDGALSVGARLVGLNP
jgi:methanogenic corrinoid protein MtbC1